MAGRLKGGGVNQARLRIAAEATEAEADEIPPMEESDDEFGIPEKPKLKKRPASDMNAPNASQESDTHGDDDDDDAKAYRNHLQRTFLMNNMSGKDSQTMAELSSNAGARGVNDFKQTGNKGTIEDNIARDLKRKMKKRSQMHDPDMVEVPTHDPQTSKNNKMAWIPVLLIHEMILGYLSSGLLFLDSACGNALPVRSCQFDHLGTFCKSHSLDLGLAIALGLHGDGVPFQNQQSVEVISWNFVAMPDKERVLF